MSERPVIYVSENDFDRLSAMLEKQDAVYEALEDELDRATLVKAEALPEGTVAMNSVVNFVNENNGSEYTLKLVYPAQASEGGDNVSILAPAGSALLGLTVGDRIDWPVSGKKVIKLRIIQVT